MWQTRAELLAVQLQQRERELADARDELRILQSPDSGRRVPARSGRVLPRAKCVVAPRWPPSRGTQPSGSNTSVWNPLGENEAVQVQLCRRTI